MGCAERPAGRRSGGPLTHGQIAAKGLGHGTRGAPRAGPGAVGKEVARVFDLSEQTISSIRTGKSHASFRPLQPNRVPSLKQVRERRAKARSANPGAYLDPKYRRMLEAPERLSAPPGAVDVPTVEDVRREIDSLPSSWRIGRRRAR